MSDAQNEGGELVQTRQTGDAPACGTGTSLQRRATPCNIFQSVIPGLEPKELQHRKLSPKQMAAMHLLLQGMSDSQVAQRLATARQTIFRWRTGNEAFVAELNLRRAGIWQQTADRLGAMVTPALDLLQRNLSDAQTMADARIALQMASTVLRLAMRCRPPEPIKREQLHRERQSAYDAALDRFINAPPPGQSRREEKQR